MSSILPLQVQVTTPSILNEYAMVQGGVVQAARSVAFSLHAPMGGFEGKAALNLAVQESGTQPEMFQGILGKVSLSSIDEPSRAVAATYLASGHLPILCADIITYGLGKKVIADGRKLLAAATDEDVKSRLRKELKLVEFDTTANGVMLANTALYVSGCLMVSAEIPASTLQVVLSSFAGFSAFSFAMKLKSRLNFFKHSTEHVNLNSSYISFLTYYSIEAGAFASMILNSGYLLAKSALAASPDISVDILMGATHYGLPIYSALLLLRIAGPIISLKKSWPNFSRGIKALFRRRDHHRKTANVASDLGMSSVQTKTQRKPAGRGLKIWNRTKQCLPFVAGVGALVSRILLHPVFAPIAVMISSFSSALLVASSGFSVKKAFRSLFPHKESDI